MELEFVGWMLLRKRDIRIPQSHHLSHLRRYFNWDCDGVVHTIIITQCQEQRLYVVPTDAFNVPIATSSAADDDKDVPPMQPPNGQT